MRRALVVGAILSVALAGAAGCGTEGPTLPVAVSTTATDETKAFCAEAIAAQEKGMTNAIAKAGEIIHALEAGESIAYLKSQLLSIADEWKTTFGELAQRQVKPEVKAALTETAAYVAGVGLGDTLDVNAIHTKLRELATKLNTACAR